MYKLFLTFRYLTRKKIVIFPILVVWLCVMMMIIVTSIMGGFVENVRKSNRQLLGDIIISNQNLAGWARYGELQEYLKKRFPEIVASTPTIQAFGLLTAGSGDNTQTEGVQIVGIDPAGRSKVARFRETLYEEYQSPMHAVEDLSPLLPATGAQLAAAANKGKDAAQLGADKAYAHYSDVEEAVLSKGEAVTASVNRWAFWGVPVLILLVVWVLRKKRTGWRWFGAAMLFLCGAGVIGVIAGWAYLFPLSREHARDEAKEAGIEATRAARTAMYAESLDPNRKYTSAAELRAALVPAEATFKVPESRLGFMGGVEGAGTKKAGEEEENGCVLGSYVLFGSRDKQGHFERHPYPEHLPVKLTVVPIGSGGTVRNLHADTEPFVVIDDSYSGVYDVDSTYVYAPFEKIQEMAEMRNTAVKEGEPGWFPPRCNEVLIKLKAGITDAEMGDIAARMQQAVDAFLADHPDSAGVLNVQTWEDKQAKYLRAVENEKNMMTFILGLMSLVVVVVIFLIFYMIVRDKTRDIGIIKAVGGSEEGVAGIFLTYGLFIGIVGGLLGVVCGVEFVLHTNQIHAWIYHMTGVIIWDRSVYVFDTIPDTVNPWEVAQYFVAALIAGVVGATIPAIVAGSEDPVKAVRYE